MNVASLGGTVISSPYCANKSKEKLGETDSSPESGSSSSEIKDEYVPSPKKESTLNAPLTYSNKDIQKCSFDSTQNNTELPESVFNYFEQKMPEVSTIVNNIKSSIHNYMNGTGSFDDIKSCIKQAYSDVQDYNISLGRIDGTNAEENTKILTALYQEAIYNTNTMCQMANTAEERSVAFSKGMDASDRFAYYNSKYYYCFKEIKQATKAACADIATDQHLTEFDAEEVERTHNGPGCWDFNTYWAGNLRDNKKSALCWTPARNRREISECFIRKAPNTRSTRSQVETLVRSMMGD